MQQTPRLTCLLLGLLACTGQKVGSTPTDSGADTADPADPADTSDTGRPTDSDSATPIDSQTDTSDTGTPTDSGADSSADTGVVERSLEDADLILTGRTSAELSGRAVASAGDFDGDGRIDLAIGASYYGSSGTEVGAAYLVLGATREGWSGTASLADADLMLTGEWDGDHAGETVVGPGDVDGDGYDDLYIGAWSSDQHDEYAGAAYWIAGPDVSDGVRSLSEADLELYKANNNLYVGDAMAPAGDVDGDGQADLILGMFEDGSMTWPEGSAALVLGVTAAGSTEDLDLSYADLTLYGVSENEGAGRAVAGAGDVDGDGLSDLWIGGWYATGTYDQGGAGYLVLGASASAWLGEVSLADADLTVEAAAELQGLGAGVAGPGDVDGDGLDDLLIGARYASTSAKYAGSVYLLLTRTLGAARGTISVATADVEVTGPRERAMMGEILAGAGDVDADGLADVQIGDPNDDTADEYAGVARLFTGASLVSAGSRRELSSADISIYGSSPSDGVGVALAPLGDLDHDGHGDLLIGAPGNSLGGSAAGATLVVTGGSL